MENTQKLPLTAEDISILDAQIKKKGRTFGGALVLALIAAFFLTFGHNKYNDKSMYESYGLFPFVMVAALFFIYYIFTGTGSSRILKKDKLAGVKKVSRYTIAEKTGNWGTSYKVYNRAGEKTKLPFDELSKNNYNVDDVIEVHYLPLSNTVLSTKVVEHV